MQKKAGPAFKSAEMLTLLHQYDIFSRLLNICRLPACFKAAVIIPVPKKSNLDCHENCWAIGTQTPNFHTSAFNPIVPDTLSSKLERLCMQHFLARWILNCLLNRLQVVKINKFSNSGLISVETVYCHHYGMLHSQKKQ